MSKLSVVIPVYNSRATIRQVVYEVIATVSEKYDYEIILVNDCSPDDVFDEISSLCAKDSRIIGINLSKNFGQHSAIMAGLNCISGDIVVCLDDDGQTPAVEMLSLIKEIESGKDLVFAKYPTKKHSGFRNFGSLMKDLMFRMFVEKPKGLAVTSYFACRRYVIDEVIKYKNPYPYVSGLLLKATQNASNAQVNHSHRLSGNSGYTFKKLLSLWINGFTAFSVKPLRFATFCGFLFAVIGFIYGLFVVIHKLQDPAVPIGYSSIMSAILFLGGLILIVLGMIGEYVGRIYVSINNSPQYVIRDSINLKGKEADENTP